jgi:hypothetical protein
MSSPVIEKEIMEADQLRHIFCAQCGAWHPIPAAGRRVPELADDGVLPRATRSFIREPERLYGK